VKDNGPPADDDIAEESSGSDPGDEVRAAAPVAAAVQPQARVTPIPEPPPPPEPESADPPSQPSFVGRLTVAISLIVLSGMGLLEATGVEIAGSENLFDPIHYAATALAIVGIGLIVSAFVGRARWLIAIGAVLLPVTILAAVVPSSFSWTFGEERYAPQSIDAVESLYELGFGELTVDLTGLSAQDLAGIGVVEVRLGAGEANVVVPSGVGIRVLGHIGAGGSDGDDPDYGDYAGFGIDVDDQIGPRPSVLTIDAEVGFGVLEVHVVDTDLEESNG